jgi:hypothetical protein
MGRVTGAFGWQNTLLMMGNLPIGQTPSKIAARSIGRPGVLFHGHHAVRSGSTESLGTAPIGGMKVPTQSARCQISG